DILREVMNTVGKPGKLGEHVKCVISVSMLTEGWDANTVTHILGVRAFGTQLLCEQVVGRGLRRMNYMPDEGGLLTPEYAEVYGVPFSFIPCAGSSPAPAPPREIYHVKAMEDRLPCEITFPRLLGYKYEIPAERLSATFDEDSILALSPEQIPTWTENAPIVGEHSYHTLDEVKNARHQVVAFTLAKLTLEKYFRDDDGNEKLFLFPQLLAISRQWIRECVRCKDNAFIQMLLFHENAHNAADRIYRAVVRSTRGEKRIKPIFKPYDTLGSTRHVAFDTSRPVFLTDPGRCHINYVVADTDSWEQKMAQTLEDMPEVKSYVKNHNLGFIIPYTVDGEERSYTPDFIVRIEDGRRPDDLLNLIIEVTGAARKDKEAKVATARNLWVPAVNNHAAFGRWDFIEITDPWDAKKDIWSTIRAC
ncbi:MAG: restriction endonuclease subunit R, partial [Candidatus Hydrogenedentes bacterium]|nr:restriction endonuclease subunit R [Candidatus Hydrogenedentota bacterium]